MYRDKFQGEQPPNYEFLPPQYPYNSVDPPPPIHSSTGMPQKFYDPNMNTNLGMNMSLPPNQPPLNIDPINPSHYQEPPFDNRFYWQEINSTNAHNPPPGPDGMKMRYTAQNQYPQNIIKKISSLIKLHLPELQEQMSKATFSYKNTEKNTRTPYHRNRRSRSPQYRKRSRQRSRQRNRKRNQRDWTCRKCSFNNFDWRNKCKKCDQLR